MNVSLRLILEIVASMWFGSALFVGAMLQAASRPSRVDASAYEVADDLDTFGAPAHPSAAVLVASTSGV